MKLSDKVGSAELRKREHENKTGGNFSLITRSYFRVSFTYASFLLSEKLEPESGFIQCIILFNKT